MWTSTATATGGSRRRASTIRPLQEQQRNAALLDSDAAPTATCMLLDIHLGGISGIELQRRLAAAGSNSPVIFMTAIDDDATRKEATNAGCIAYLKKPFAPQLLLDAIREAAA